MRIIDMKGIDTICGNAPSVWASYLINGDSSGLEESDIREADQFAKWLGGYIVDCTSEDDENHPGFTRWHDAAQFGTLAADCAQYTALIERI